MGATADGNYAGKSVAHGVTPQCSSMKYGMTAAINSCISIPPEIYNGGASTMWDLDCAWASEDIISNILRVFMDNGGQIFQGNATDVESLLKAQESPEDYNHIIVRVGGYSARFVNLSKELQEDIINRTRYKI